MDSFLAQGIAPRLGWTSQAAEGGAVSTPSPRSREQRPVRLRGPSTQPSHRGAVLLRSIGHRATAYVHPIAVPDGLLALSPTLSGVVSSYRSIDHLLLGGG